MGSVSQLFIVIEVIIVWHIVCHTGKKNFNRLLKLSNIESGRYLDGNN